LSKRVRESNDTEKIIDDFHKVMKAACEKTFRRPQAAGTIITNKSIPWRTEELTIMRKRTNALRRRYQRTRTHEGLREQRKTRYLEEKARYEARIRREKIDRGRTIVTRRPPTHGMRSIKWQQERKGLAHS
jgi:hypothetical protein